MYIILLLALLGSMALANKPEVALENSLYHEAHRQAMPLLLGVLSNDDEQLMFVAKLLAQNLERSGQFKVDISAFKVPSKQAELEKLFDAKYPLEIFLEHDDNGSAIKWRLYDVPDKKLIKGMKYTKRGKFSHGYADNIADELWPILTSEPSSFSTKLAYVKRTAPKGKRQQSIICIANSDGSQEQVIVPKLGTYVSLYWHSDAHNPCLFCSEFTRYNVRFASANMHGRKTTVLDLKGTCVGISVSHDNNKAVYCRSGTIWLYSYDAHSRQGVHSVLISNEGKNVSPTLLNNGDVIFCSDAASLRKDKAASQGPKIYRYNAKDGTVTLLTKDGYCVGPSYCAANGKIAYSKRIDGVMQLFIYDPKRTKETQATFDAGNKIDCSWSPCGRYVVYCYQRERSSRIVMIHVAMKHRTYITPAKEFCTCPAWSPVYGELPMMS
jgi:TolB protein